MFLQNYYNPLSLWERDYMATKDRKVWFITRSERDPAFHKEALEALSDTTENFSLKWKGNRAIHKRYEEILHGHNVRENITKQILTLQIPNAYFLESGFKPKYESDFSIRPARFLIKLCCSELLNYYITKEELTFLVIVLIFLLFFSHCRKLFPSLPSSMSMGR